MSKMTSSKFEKYLNHEKVDKLECPKEFYNDIKTAIPIKISNLEKQLERVKADGKSTEVIEKIQNKIDKLNKIDEMVEQSNTTTNEAIFARLHPKCAATKIFVPEAVKLSNKEGIKGGALGYGTAFISTSVSQTMKVSANQLIRNAGKSCLPTATVSFAVESYDSISDYAQGKIDGNELAYDLGENAVSIAGSVKGAVVGESVGEKVGAVVGTVAGPGGTAAGAAGLVVGGLVGCAVASEVYGTAMQVGLTILKNLQEQRKSLLIQLLILLLRQHQNK